ncbi:MAG: tRNA 2-thiouridine(34) synthase MnmA [Chlamydiia bacterium]
MSKKCVVVGLSGGVDSSVSAHLLKKEGHEVIALFMKNWEEVDSDGVCPAEEDQKDVIRVAKALDIPYYTVNYAKEYKERVFEEFLDGLKKGLTPNPDLLCNREIKFKALLETAEKLGADFLATGHYCRRDLEGRLLKGIDPLKDQSYFLAQVHSNALKKSLFPIGELHKTVVREIAKQADLVTHNKKDSTGICFIGNKNFKKFIQSYIPITVGNFYDLESGKKISSHEGACFYTIGERACISGSDAPYFVAKKEENSVFVVKGKDHPALFTTKIKAHSPFWIHEIPDFTKDYSAKVRYRQSDQKCRIELESQGLAVYFDTPQRAVTPGQYIVFYDKEVCLGSAIIDCGIS